MNEWDGNFELVDPHDIQFDRAKYQRAENWPLISRIGQDLKWPAFVVIPCAKREYAGGILYAYDGQQRILGALASENPPKHVPVVWWPFKTRADEAACFIEVNVNRVAVAALGKFKAQIGAENPMFLQIVAATERAGFAIGVTAGESRATVSAVGGLQAIYNSVGEEGVYIGLTAYKEAWPDSNAPSATMLNLLAEVMGDMSSNGGLSVEGLTKACSRTTQVRIMRKAEQIHYEQGGSKKAAVRKAFKELAKV